MLRWNCPVLWSKLAAGRLLPPVDAVFPLAEGRKAYERMTSQAQFGKLVLSVS